MKVTDPVAIQYTPVRYKPYQRERGARGAVSRMAALYKETQLLRTCIRNAYYDFQALELEVT